MKIIKTDNPYLTKDQWRKVFTAMSIMVIALYIVAMVFSLCGSKYFILNYQNEQMDRIEAFLRQYNLIALLQEAFMTVETFIILLFILNKRPKFYYIIFAYAVPLIVAYSLGQMPSWLQTGICILIYILCPIVEQLISTKRFSWKEYGKSMIRFAIAMAVTFILQLMIYIIKAGYFSVDNHIMNISAVFIYAIEYDIALLVILMTISLYINREKGDSRLWTSQPHCGFSQTSKKQSPKSSLTKTQKTKLRLLYLRFYLTQLGAFLLLMVLPFLLGKVFEFLVMYTAFAVVRYILGFKYSLHYKKEALCITVGAVVFGILSLAVPFFYVVVIMAILLGVGLAILLHFSYKYKGFYLFNKISKPDKFAELYVLMDGDLSPHHVKIICHHRGLDREETEIVSEFAEGNKKSYIAKKHNYSEKTIERKINEAIDKLNNI